MNQEIKDKTILLGIEIIDLHNDFTEIKDEQDLSKKLLESGGSFCKTVNEIEQDDTDLKAKLVTSQKECEHTISILNKLVRDDYFTDDKFLKMESQAQELNNIICNMIIENV